MEIAVKNLNDNRRIVIKKVGYLDTVGHIFFRRNNKEYHLPEYYRLDYAFDRNRY